MKPSRIHRSAAAFLLGVAAGGVSALAECLLAPLPLGLRLPYVVGVYGLIGGGLGLVASWALPARKGLRPVLALLIFVPTAAGLAMVANRIVLQDVHHLEPLSLGADGVAVLLAAAVAAMTTRACPRFRRRAESLPLVALLTAAALVAGVRAPHLLLDRGEPDESRPPVVLVSIDTLRPDRLGAGGEPTGTSPELDRLCREAVHFPETFAVSPGSAASHAALLTSRYPISNGVHTNFSVLDESVTTLTEILRDQGYRTGGFVTNMFLGERFGFPQGFDAYVQTGVVERLREVSPALLWRSLGLVQILDHVRSRVQLGYDPSFETALTWIAESHRPTFFFVHFMDVHSPYVPPAPWGRRFGATRSGSEVWDGETNPYGWRRSDEVYLAEIGFTDTKIGRLRRQLDRIDLLDESVLVVTSDHGENLSDHAPHYSHGSTLFDATLRVLFAARAPGRLQPSLDPREFENLDLPPSLAFVLGLPRHEDWEGRNAFRESDPGREITVAQIYRDFAVRTKDAKFLLKEDGNRTVWRLDTDPAEQRPLAPTGPDLARVEAEFQAWFEAHVTDLYARGGQEVTTDELSPETVERLRTLGYLR